MATSTDPTAAVLDASALVAYGSREPGRDAAVEQYLGECAAAVRTVYAPGVVVGECLYVFCKKRAAGEVDAAAHDLAVGRIARVMRGVRPPPAGDGALVEPAARLTGGYTCTKSNDSIYLALAEQLAAGGAVVEVATFDGDQAKRADRIDGVAGRLLAPDPAAG